MVYGIVDAPVPDNLERDYCSDSDVEFMASGLNIDLETVWGGGFTTSQVRQIAALEIEQQTNRYFFPVRHIEVLDGGFRYLIPNYLPILEVEECYANEDVDYDMMPYLQISPYRIRTYTELPSGLNNITLIYIAGYEEVPQHIRWANAIAVVFRALGMDPNWIDKVLSSGGRAGSGERLTVGPVTMEEGGAGLAGLRELRLDQMAAQYVAAIQREQSLDFKTTSREDRYKRHHEWLYEEQFKRGGPRYS